MPAIDRELLLTDIYMWLPEQNILTDGQILVLAESVISGVGDDDTNRSEVTCKSLRAAALANKTLSSGSNNVKREKSYQREIEFHTRDDDTLWDKYLEGLTYLCPLLPGGGYTISSPSSVGFYASVSDPIKVPDLTDVPHRLPTKSRT